GEVAVSERRLTSLRVEMLVSLAVLATVALLLAVTVALLVDGFIGSRYGAYIASALVIADVAVFVFFGASKLRTLVERPIEQIVEATEVIAAGDLTRRVPPSNVAEFARLATSVNHMTNRLLEEQTLVARFEKMAGVGRLAAGLAHEIGNPLGAINGYIHMLRRQAGNGGQLEDTLKGIEHESMRIDRIMRGMLDYARPRRRCTTLVDLNDSVQRVVTMLQDQGVLSGIRVDLTLASRISPLVGDRDEIDQVLVNLLSNASDAIGESGRVSIVTQQVPFAEMFGSSGRRSGDSREVQLPREPSARLRAWLNTVGEPKEVVKLVVADSGPGVAWSDSERIFDPFYTTKGPGRATGLGLAVVARIVESVGGTIWVRQARESGAAFFVLFPVPERSPTTVGTGAGAGA
ncbi:MAG TPA: ATP-binding protein, partial [Gemmatimonadaceae bacterium]|nr:ATP-binding protein [Gemmatimonadaceae bacterium]